MSALWSCSVEYSTFAEGRDVVPVNEVSTSRAELAAVAARLQSEGYTFFPTTRRFRAQLFGRRYRTQLRVVSTNAYVPARPAQ